MSQVTGPYTVNAGTVLHLNDPTGSLSNRAQIQNGSGYTLTVANGQGSSEIGPNTAATVLSQGGATITLTAGNSGTSGNGISVVWLLPADKPATPDGPLVTSLSIGSVTISSGTVNIGNTPTVSIGNTPQVTFAAGSTVDINSGSVNIVNSYGTNGVNVAPKATSFRFVAGSTGAVLLGGVSSSSYTIHSVIVGNNSGVVAQVTFTDSYTGSQFQILIGSGGAPVLVPLDFSLQAGSEFSFSSTQGVAVSVIYGA